MCLGRRTSSRFLQRSIDVSEVKWSPSILHLIETPSIKPLSEVAQRGYGLAPLAVKLGIQFEHHDAAEDARAAGMILVRAMAEMDLDLVGWMDRVKRPIHGSSMAHDGNPDGPLYGEVATFTGALIIPRHEAADLAARAGCETTDGVTKHTTLLVVGDQDIRQLNGQEKSNKHRKAEELIAKGRSIRILTETDFLSMVDHL